jgi:hypothetical protein
VGREDREIIGQRQDLLVQGAVQLSCEGLAWFASEEVGTPDGSDHQRSAAEQRFRRAVNGQEVGEVVRCVPGCRNRPQLDVLGQRDDLVRVDGAVLVLELRRTGREERRAMRGGSMTSACPSPRSTR